MYIYNILLSTAIVVLVSTSIYFSIKLCFPQLKLISLFKGFKKDKNSPISPFKSLTLTLAAKVGVGSLAGVALAIYLGGPGTIFWIWVITLITAIISYVEAYLGLKYQTKDISGGPYYYIDKGLNKKILAKGYAILILITYIVGFITIQANTIVVSVSTYINISKYIIAISISLISLISILGKKEIINITSKIVPIMGISYIILGLIIIIDNISIIPSVFTLIIKSALNIKSFSTGFIITMLIGIRRSLFITEVGLGTNAIASSSTFSKDKINLSLIQVVGVYFTVFIICTITALIILTSNYNNLIINNINGIELIQYSLNYHLGNTGGIILLITIFFLAYSTIIAGYYYGECSLNYLTKKGNIILKILTVLIIFIGGITNSLYLWKIVDLFILILILINTYSIYKLRKEVIFDYQNTK